MNEEIITAEPDRAAEAAEQISQNLSEYLPRLIDSISEIHEMQVLSYFVIAWICGILGLMSGLMLVLILKKD